MAGELTQSDRDLHRFMWRDNPDSTLQDYCMTRVKFGVSAPSFLVNMSTKQNALDFALKDSLAVKVVNESFCINGDLPVVDSIEEAIKL